MLLLQALRSLRDERSDSHLWLDEDVDLEECVLKDGTWRLKLVGSDQSFSINQVPRLSPRHTFLLGREKTDALELAFPVVLKQAPGLYFLQSRAYPWAIYLCSTRGQAYRATRRKDGLIKVSALGRKISALILDPSSLENRKAFRDHEEPSKRMVSLFRFELAVAGRDQVNRKLGSDSGSLFLEPSDLLLALKKVESISHWDDIESLSTQNALQIGDILAARLNLDWITRIIHQSLPKKYQVSLAQVVEALDRHGFDSQVQDELARLFSLSRNRNLRFPSRTNLIADLSQRYAVLRKSGNRNSDDPAAHDLHPSYRGRLGPLETPLSDQIGFDLHLTPFCRINAGRKIESPYWQVHDGKKTEEVEWLSPEAEETAVIAFAGQEGPDGFLEETVWARKGLADSLQVGRAEVTHLQVYPGQNHTSTVLLVPFLQHNDPNRVMIAASQLKQALPLAEPQTPMISAGAEQMLVAMSGEVLHQGHEADCEPLGRTPLGVLKGHLKERGTFGKSGAEAGRIVIDVPSTLNGQLALGTNLLCAYVPWKGYNFEDAVVISESASKALTSLHGTWEKDFLVLPSMQMTMDNPFLTEKEKGHLTEEGIAKCDERLPPGSVLLSAFSTDHSADANDSQLFLDPFGSQAKQKRDESFRLPKDVEGVLTSVGRPSHETEHRWRFRIEDRRPALVGDKLSHRYGGKWIISRILPDDEMPTFYENEDGELKKRCIQVILNPLGVINRMNIGQILETHLGWLAHKTGCRFEAPAFGSIRLTQGEQNSSAAEAVQKILDQTDKKPPVDVISALMSEFAEESIGKHSEPQPGVSIQGTAWLHDPAQPAASLDRPVVVGWQYFNKLNHLASNKFHFREDEDAYSIVSQQPLRGRPLGGQRLGEMEAWALMANSAWRNLEECFLEKSDDIKARESEAGAERGVPESLCAFLYYLRARGMDPTLLDDSQQDITEDIFRRGASLDRIATFRLVQASDERVKSWGKEVSEPLPIDRADLQILSQQDTGLFDETIFGLWHSHEPPVGLLQELLNSTLEGKNPAGLAPENLLSQLEETFTPGSIRDFIECLDEGDSQSQAIQMLKINQEKAQMLRKWWPRQRMGWIELPEPVTIQDGPKANEETIRFLSVLPYTLRPCNPSQRDQRDRPMLHDLNHLYDQILTIKANWNASESHRNVLRKAIQALFFFGIRGHRTSLSSIFAGKSGHIRGRMLGKRVNFSGRSVIVPEPALLLDEVGINLPQQIPSGSMVLLNRQPSLHYLSMQGARVADLKELHRAGDQNVILLNPLVIAAFGADFDGDTMAFYRPLSSDAKKEAEGMLPSHNYRSRANGKVHFKLDADLEVGWTVAVKNETLLAELGAILQIRDVPLPSSLAEWIEQALEQAETKPESYPATLKRIRQVIQLLFRFASQSGVTWSLLENDEALSLPTANGTSLLFQQKAVKEDSRKQIFDKKGPVVYLHPQYRGLPKGGIQTSYCQGLNPGEYFAAAYGTRKNNVEKKIMVGYAGELNRWLVHHLEDWVITEDDCGTKQGREVTVGPTTRDYLRGRLTIEGKILKGSFLRDLQDGTTLQLRSPLFCTTSERMPNAICRKCWGEDLASHEFPPAGAPIGLLAATFLGERGTQLQMKAIHLGGGGEALPIQKVKRLLRRKGEKIADAKVASSTFQRWINQVRGLEPEVDGEVGDSPLKPYRAIDDRYLELLWREQAEAKPESALLEAAYGKTDGFRDQTLQSLAQAAMHGLEVSIGGFRHSFLFGQFRQVALLSQDQ